VTYFEELSQVLSRVDPAPLLDFVRGCEGTLWVAGNGGSASNAQHWACDLSKAAGRRVQALGANPAVLTAWANDTSYDEALAWELARLWQPDDRLIVLSCSGASGNIAQLLRDTVRMGNPCALLTGQRYLGDVYADLIIRIPSTNYGIIEDAMSAIGHWLTEELQK
jgi:D-sedoheptulose 7-phosphate isomerase